MPRVIVEDQAWVTLATNDAYALGSLVLAHSLMRVETNRRMAILVTPTVSQAMRDHLHRVYDHVCMVDVLDSQDSAHLSLMSRPELGVTFTKLHCWTLTQYRKCVFLDSDTLMLQNADDLFERDELSAAPDIGWPDCFNSGVFVFKPSEQTYLALLKCAEETGSFDGGDQGLLNTYFSDWATADIRKHLSFIYNMVVSSTYTYQPAFKQFGGNVKIVHFLGSTKPWTQHYNIETRTVEPGPCQSHIQKFLQNWWNIFVDEVKSTMYGKYTDLPTTVQILKKQEPERSLDEVQRESQYRKAAWENGHIDYMGKDSFDNILKKISEELDKVLNGK